MEKERGAKGLSRRRTMRPEQVLVLGFLILILAGTALLSLPAASADGKSAGFFDSLFTSTSAVCVTGLVARDSGTGWSRLGQVVLLCLIQTGGLGFMVFATLIMVALGRRITLRNKIVMREAMSENTWANLSRLMLGYGLMVALVELVGAAFLCIRLVPKYGWGEGIFLSVFHAVSAFCNAGFDLFGQFSSVTGYANDPVVLLTLSVLIILGGLGFSVIFECIRRRFHWKEFSLHTRIVLLATGLLLLFGSVFFCLAEWTNDATLGSLSPAARIMNGFFQSVTLRTAGFNSIDQAGMRDASKLMSVIFMFIGASPASTGGGVKTTTVSVLFLIVYSVVRGQQQVNLMGRRLPADLMRRALTILFISLAILLIGTMALTILEGGNVPFLDILYECASALGTAGVTSVGTPNLRLASRAVLIPMMFFGRVGPLTLALALTNKQKNDQNLLKYPEEKIMIG